MTETIFASSALILAVVLLRALLGGKVSARLVYALWLPVVARLLVPWSLPVSPMSAVSIDILRKTESVLSSPVIPPEPVFIPPATLTFDDYPAGDIRAPEPEPEGTPFVSRRFPKPEPAPSSATRSNVLHVIWYLGILVVGGAVVLSNIRFYYYLCRTRKRLEIAAPCPVWLAEGLPSPCLYGNAVYLNIPLEGEQLRHVLAHELTHRRHGDALWAVLTSVCLTVYWFNPLVWLAVSLSRRDCELACDEGALAMLDPQERISYGRTLLALVEHRRRPSDFLCHATMMSKSAMGARIRRIAKQPRTYAAAVLLIAVGLVLACVVSYTSPDRYVSHEVMQAIETGCLSESPGERAAWERLRDEFLPAYRKAVDEYEKKPVFLEAVSVEKKLTEYAGGEEYHNFYWYLRPERELSYETVKTLDLGKNYNAYKLKWPLLRHAVSYERTTADGSTILTDMEYYNDQSRRDWDELRWTEFEINLPGGDFSDVAQKFMEEIGKKHLSVADHNSAGATSYEIQSVKILGTYPDNPEHFVFEGTFLFTPVVPTNLHWSFDEANVFSHDDGTLFYRSQYAAIRDNDGIWHLTGQGLTLLSDAYEEYD